MAKGKERKIELTAYDDLFQTDESREEAKQSRIQDIPLSEIDEFPDHPFKVLDDDDMAQLVESIQRNGVMTPAMVRRKEDGRYELISGHRRCRACALAGLTTLKCEVRELTRDEAVIIMVESNLQRSVILPSEKAKAYKLKMDAMKRQGKRTDLTSDPVGSKLGLRSNRELAASSPDGKTQIQRYIRLTYLIPPLLGLVDENKIAMRPAVELSYLSKSEQTALHEMMEQEDCTPSHAQAIKMRRFSEEGKLSEDVILSIMQEEKPNQKEQFRMPKEKISKYFPAGTPAQKIEDTIIKALELYQRQRRHDRER